MPSGFRKTLRGWFSTSSSSSVDGDVPPSGASSSRPPSSSLDASGPAVSVPEGSPPESPAPTTSAVATSVLLASAAASAVPVIPLPTHKHSASQSTDTSSGVPPPREDSANPTVPKNGSPADDSASNTPKESRSRAASNATQASEPQNMLQALAPLGVQCALSIAQVAAELAPIPYIGPLVECLTVVFQAVERSKVNKDQWKLLQGRCVMVTRIAGAKVSNHGEEDDPRMKSAAHQLEKTLNNISQKARQYNEMNEMLALLQFQSISEEIQGLFNELDECLRLFSFAADVAQSQWVNEFKAVQKQELAELQRVHSLLEKMNIDITTISQNQDHNHDQLVGMIEVLRQELVAMSSVIQNQATTTVASFEDAQQIVRTILAVTHLQLPPKLLLGRQCIIDANIPIGTGITCDVYSASFLGGEKVAKKVFRIGVSDQGTVERYAKRFLRMAELWSDFKSHYTLPFYGVGMESFEGNQHFQLYMVSPWMKNFDAISYLKQYRNTAGMNKRILRIITDAALGLQYLHNRDPPVVHSGMRGDNILITDSGGGILGGFGLTKALESEGTGGEKLPPAVMTGRTESQRWMAPELFQEDTPVLKTSCDVWGWAMAALEIVSGSIPYHSHTQALTVMLKVTQGPPRRKDHIKFEDYAYRPDEMWELLERCWKHNPEERPTIDEVVVRLKQIAKMEEYVKQ